MVFTVENFNQKFDELINALTEEVTTLAAWIRLGESIKDASPEMISDYNRVTPLLSVIFAQRNEAWNTDYKSIKDELWEMFTLDEQDKFRIAEHVESKLEHVKGLLEKTPDLVKSMESHNDRRVDTALGRLKQDMTLKLSKIVGERFANQKKHLESYFGVLDELEQFARDTTTCFNDNDLRMDQMRQTEEEYRLKMIDYMATGGKEAVRAAAKALLNEEGHNELKKALGDHKALFKIPDMVKQLEFRLNELTERLELDDEQLDAHSNWLVRVKIQEKHTAERIAELERQVQAQDKRTDDRIAELERQVAQQMSQFELRMRDEHDRAYNEDAAPLRGKHYLVWQWSGVIYFYNISFSIS